MTIHIYIKCKGWIQPPSLPSPAWADSRCSSSSTWMETAWVRNKQPWCSWNKSPRHRSRQQKLVRSLLYQRKKTCNDDLLKGGNSHFLKWSSQLSPWSPCFLDPLSCRVKFLANVVDLSRFTWNNGTKSRCGKGGDHLLDHNFQTFRKSLGLRYFFPLFTHVS